MSPMKSSLVGPDGQFNATNEFAISFPATGPLTATRISAYTKEGDVVDLADRTRASGGRTKPFNIEIDIPTHLVEENLRMEAWHQAFLLKLPGYKIAGIVTYPMNWFTGAGVSDSLIGAMCISKGRPEVDANSDGDMMVTTWTISVDDTQQL